MSALRQTRTSGSFKAGIILKTAALLSISTLLLTQTAYAYETPTADATAKSISFQKPSTETIGKVAALKTELGLAIHNNPLDKDNACHLILVDQGSTTWSAENRLQGWVDVSLSDEGRKEITALSKQLSDVNFDGMYCSDFQRTRETASILVQGHKECSPIVADPALRGEAHGKLEGMTPTEYRQSPRYKQYKALTNEEQMFFSFGEDGESIADVARRMMPFLKRVCEENLGKTVVIVTHGGNLKFLNYLMGDCASESFVSIPHGEYRSGYSDGTSFVKG